MTGENIFPDGFTEKLDNFDKESKILLEKKYREFH